MDWAHSSSSTTLGCGRAKIYYQLYGTLQQGLRWGTKQLKSIVVEIDSWRPMHYQYIMYLGASASCSGIPGSFPARNDRQIESLAIDELS
jgi:hypothetical protein